MDFEENRYNLANVSTISESSSCTDREQVSQLDADINGYLHSTFNYPLHSTINFMDMTMIHFTQNNAGSSSSTTTSSSSNTLTDSNNVLMKLNENLRASEIKDSTLVSSKESSSVNTASKNLSSDSAADGDLTVMAKSFAKERREISRSNVSGKSNCVVSSQAQCEVLLPDQSYPVQPSISSQRLLLDCDESEYSSECDSSCLSIDVDDISLSGLDEDEELDHKLFQRSPLKSHLVNHTIRDHVGAQMWGSNDDYSRSVVPGDCDVCQVIKMKRQQARSDLWIGSRKTCRQQQKSSFTNTKPSVQNSFDMMITVPHHSIPSSVEKSVKKLSLIGQKRGRNDSWDNMCSPAKRQHTTVSPTSRKQKKDKRQLNTPKKKPKSLFTNKPDLGERLNPEGMEDFGEIENKENCRPTAGRPTQFNCDSKNNSGNYNTRKVSSKHCTNETTPGQSHRNSEKYSSRCNNTPKQRSDRTPTRDGQSNTFCDKLPPPSPWTGDQKLIKKKLKQLSFNTQNGERRKSSIHTLGCF